jgi:hypothetical protein
MPSRIIRNPSSPYSAGDRMGERGVSFEEFRDVVGLGEWARLEETYRVRRGT